MERWLAIVVSVALGCAGRETARVDSTRRLPNVVLVMTDDQGLGDFGYAGNPVLETPHLDALAASSPRFERFYVSPVCSPTRASLMTGRYNQRTRVLDTYRGRASLEPDEVTLAEILRDAGYATGIFGKWHLGDAHPLRPMDQGFENSLVHRAGGLAQPSEPPANARRYTDPVLLRDGEPVETRGYCTDVFFDAALEFIDASRERGRPFFAYVTPNAPHGPFHDVPADLHAKYARSDLGRVVLGKKGDAATRDRIARTYAMIENIDQNVGRLLAHLEAAGIADDTLVVFLCDNGPEGARYVRGLRGSKASVHEGGIRSPLMVRWGERLSPGTRVDRIAAHIDLLPTVLEAAGVPAPSGIAFDGRSLWPLLLDSDTPWPERQLVIQAHRLPLRGDVPAREHHFAVIGERWKLVRASGFGRARPDPGAGPGPDGDGGDGGDAGAPFELFDLRADPGERRDRAAEHPEIVARMRAFYARWYADVAATRPDPFAPPRIVPDPRAEPVTTLTRNDWLVLSGGGYGEDGEWLLDAPRALRVELRLFFTDRRDVSAATVHLGAGRALSGHVADTRDADGRTTVTLAPFDLPAGPTDLRVVCATPAGAPFAPHQVELRVR